MMKEGLITPEPQTTEDEILDPDIGALLAQIMAANGQEMTMQVADAPSEPAKVADIVADTPVMHIEKSDMQEDDQKAPSMYSISDDDEDEDNTMFSITTDDTDDMLDLDADADIDMQLNLDAEPVDTFNDFSGAVLNIATEEDNVAILLTEEPKASENPSGEAPTPSIEEGGVDVNDVLAQVSQDLKTVFSTDSEEDTLTNLTAQFEQMHINPSSAPTEAEKDIPALLDVTPNEAVNVEEIMAQVTHDIQLNNPGAEDTEDTLANLTAQFERMHLGEPLRPSSKSKYVNEHNEVVDVKEIMAQVAHDLNKNVNEDDTLISLTEQFERIKQDYPVDNHKVHVSFGISKEEIHRSELRAKAAETTAEQLKANEHTEPLTTDDKLKDVIQAEHTVESTPEVDSTIHEVVATLEEVQTNPPVITPSIEPVIVQPKVEQNSAQSAPVSTEHHATESIIPERRKDIEAPTRGGFLTNATMFTKAATPTPRRPERKPTHEIVEEARVNQRVSEIMKENNPQREESNHSRVSKYRSEKIGDIDLVLLTEEGVFNDVFKLLSKHVNEYVTEISSLKNQLQASLTAGTNATSQPDYELLTQLAMMEEENNNLKIDNTSLTRRVSILEHEMATIRKKYEDLMLEMMDVQADNTRLEKALGNL